jgi:hypothetical protein
MPISSRFGVISIFLIKYSFFYQAIVLFEFLFKNRIAINGRYEDM